jgi:DNA-binding CsgD family transcriptional regulator
MGHGLAAAVEVLFWIPRGKQNRDIADILGLSLRTTGMLPAHGSETGLTRRWAAC